MASIERRKIVQDISTLISLWNNWRYNLPDLLVEPLYIQALKKNRSLGVRARIRRRVYLLKGFLWSKIKKVRWPDRKSDVILIAGTVAHISQLGPVAKELRRNGISCYWIVTKQKVVKELAIRQENFFFVDGYFIKNPFNTTQIAGYLKSLFQKAEIDSQHRNIWYQHFVKYLNEVLGLIHLYEQTIAYCNPKAVLVGNDLTLEGRVAAVVFRKSNLFTACVQHGEVSGLLDSFHVVDTFFTYGTKAASALKQVNNKTNFIVTGAPYLDGLSINKGIDRLIAKKLAIVNPYILVAFSGSGNNTSELHHRLQIESVQSLAVKYPHIQIVIKLHPKDKVENYQYPINLEVLPNVKVVKFGQPGLPKSIFDWLRGSMILVTGASTVSIEAMSLGIPVVTIDFMNEYSEVEFIVENTAFVIRDQKSLIPTVEALLAGQEEHRKIQEQAAKYAQNYFFRDEESTAAQRIVKEITQNIDHS